MSIKQLVRDDDAVSPVIGVIMMVAITVILAAVIGAFVLGLGDQIREAPPNNDISVNGDADNREIVLEHRTGESIEKADVRVAFRDSTDTNLGTQRLHELDTSGEFSVGDTIRIGAAADAINGNQNGAIDKVQLVHTPTDSIIASGDVSDADLYVDGDSLSETAPTS